MRAVLTDSGPLYASVDPSDSLHERSQEERERLHVEGMTTIVSYATLQEAHRLVLQKLGRTVALTFLKDLLTTTPFIAPTDDDYYNALERVLRYPDQDISLADAICAELSERLAVPVWAYDHHFDVMQVTVWR